MGRITDLLSSDKINIAMQLGKILTNKKDIKNWLDEMGIIKYTIIRKKIDGENIYCVNVEGNVNLSNKNLTIIPVKFNEVEGFFDCSNNKLISLKHAPHQVKIFDCHNNELKSLLGVPLIIAGEFLCQNNQLTSLIGGPVEVFGDFDCAHNLLSTLKGSPAKVYGDFYCEFNPLNSLKHDTIINGTMRGQTINPSNPLYESFENVRDDYFYIKSDIVMWLLKMKIENYTIDQNHTVDVNQDVNISYKNLKSIPIKFGRIKGNFNCSYNKLRNLDNMPDIVGGSFDCSNNQLFSLRDKPKKIWGDFIYDNNNITEQEIQDLTQKIKIDFKQYI